MRWGAAVGVSREALVLDCLDATTCRVIAFHVGDRSRKRGEQREANIPMVYQREAVFYSRR